MKVLVVIPAVGLEYGGPSKSVLDLVKWCGREAGGEIRIDIVTTNANGSTNLDVKLNVWIEEESYRIKYFAFTPVSDYKLSAGLTKWLFAHVGDYDVVHTNAIFSYPVVAAWATCRLRRVPYIITPHGMLEPWALKHKGWKKRLHYPLIEKSMLDAAAAVQALNAVEVADVKTLGVKSRVVCVPNGVDPDGFAMPFEAGGFYKEYPHLRERKIILFLARVDPKKGLDLLAPAFADVLNQFSDAHLVIAGPDNVGFLSTAQNYFEQSGCASAVTFTGMLKGEMKHAALAAANVYVLPSYSEGFSMAILEAMAAGLPCVITKNCNFPEAAAAHAALTVETDAGEIAKALIECLANPHDAAEMGARAREFVFDNYTWNSIARRMNGVYESLVSGTSSDDNASLI